MHPADVRLLSSLDCVITAILPARDLITCSTLLQAGKAANKGDTLSFFLWTIFIWLLLNILSIYTNVYPFYSMYLNWRCLGRCGDEHSLLKMITPQQMIATSSRLTVHLLGRCQAMSCVLARNTHISIQSKHTWEAYEDHTPKYSQLV